MIKYHGLSAAEVEESRRLHGENILTPPEKESTWKRFLQTLTGPFGHLIPGWQDGDMLVFILELAALLSVGISLSEYNGWLGMPVSLDGAKVFFEPAGIIIAILLASGVGFIAEMKAEKEFEVLNQVNDEDAVTVVRDGHAQQVKKCDIVVGDIVVLTVGEEIPADARLLESTQLSVDESTLTGELLAHKDADESKSDPTATYPVCNVYRGTKVVEGHAVAEVFAVGDKTENGKVFTASKIDDGKKTPLNEQFDRLGITITSISCIVGALVLIGRIVIAWPLLGENIGLFIAHVLQSIMIAVTLVVCAVPEGLPMAVTMALAYSMRRMLKTNNLVRKMHACETMGATTVICTDKTGTLTQNKMQVADTLFDETAMQDVTLCMAVNSTALLDGTEVLGNPTEGALLLWLKEKNEDYAALRESVKKTGETPFSTEIKYMSTTIEGDIEYVKGAPEVVMGMCSAFAVAKNAAETKLRQWQQKAMRTLGFAVKKTDGAMTFLGCVAISDPVRAEVPAAVKECQDAGIRIIMVTGDNVNTAREIGRQIGIHDLDHDIIARAKPMDKRTLVAALQEKGEVVAVTGDGTNDAPALKKADVGLSMGSGTSVAKEASDITIIDDSFASIGRAVMWGRSLYINIQRFILFQLTVNITACLTVMIGAFITPEPVLTVTQMLWVNLIMDTFAALALASLPPSKEVMKSKPRRRSDNIIDRAMATDIIGTGLYFTALMIGLLLTFHPFTLEEKTVFFTFFIMLQFWNIFFAKTFKARDGLKQLFKGRAFWFVVAMVFFGQLFIVDIAYNFFNVAPLSPELTAITIGTSFVAVALKLIPRAISAIRQQG